MTTQDISGTAATIDQFNEERFQFANSGFARATAGDHTAARELSLRMLESAIRLQEMVVVPPTVSRPVRKVEHSVW